MFNNASINNSLLEGLLDWCEANNFEGVRIGRGKTVMRKALLDSIKSEPRVIMIEEAVELRV